MELRRARVSTSVRTEGGLLPADLLAKVAASDRDVPGLADADFGLAAGDRVREAVTRSWNRLVGSWAALTAARVAAADEHEPLTTPTRERWLLPLFEELGFGRLTIARAVEIEGTAYPISHAWERVPIHLVGFGVELDRRTPGVRGAAGAAPHALVQEYLNRSDAALWGVLSNGRLLRLLRDSTSLTRQAFVEFDLEAIFEGELYADFALLWSVCHRTRFEGERPADCLLERWTKKAADDGTRALDKLRGGVERAIEALGAGFLAHPANSALREALRTGELDRQDYYRELLRLVYRLIFLFTAEDRHDETTGRELLLDPAASDAAAERYRRYYSTARVRAIAGRKRGTRHPDLWIGLRRVVAALGGAGAPTLALPALGSFLFGPTACPHLDGADLRNEDLLDAVRALATIEEDRRLRLVDYRNLGAEELGGIYEGLLELHPRIELDANPPRFVLGTVAGNERKSTGSYYTPTSLINCLLDSALDPVVDEAVAGKRPEDAERALLALAVVDPAAGSGHFLVAAAHRLAKRLAAIRTGEGEPPPAAVRHALRDVIAHCIYAVDLNPMAVELCKVSLWLEALEPGRPLSFLDAHVKVGNSLLGATPELVTAGIPDGAYETLIGDDGAIVRAQRSRNKQERDAGQQSLFEAPFVIPSDALASEVRSLDELPDDTPAAIAAKAARHASFLASADYQQSRAALDAWCTAFVAPKGPGTPEITTAVVRSIGTDPARLPGAVRELVDQTSAEYGFFHWPLEFPGIVERGGFDAVIGNPPWEIIEFKEQAFFEGRHSGIANAANSADRKRQIGRLRTEDPALFGVYQAQMRLAAGAAHLAREGDSFPLSAVGRLNTYSLFVERGWRLVGRQGRLGLVVPTGIATDENTSRLFGAIVRAGQLVSLTGFDNRLPLFPDIGSMLTFAIVVLAGNRDPARSARYTFFNHSVDDLGNPERSYELSPDEISLLNPNTNTAPVFLTRRDAEITIRAYRGTPVLARDDGGDDSGWRPVLRQGLFNMASDSSRFSSTGGPELAPLYEAKMIHQFDHRHASADDSLGRPDRYSVIAEARPRYWVARSLTESRIPDQWRHEWLLGWRNVCRSTDERTLIASVLPRTAVGHSLPLLFPDADAPLALCLLANLNAVALDYIARQKLGGPNLTFFVLRQLPVLPKRAWSSPCPWDSGGTLKDWMLPRVGRLVITSQAMIPLGREIGMPTAEAWDEELRRRTRAEIDAAFFLLYGLSAAETEHVLESFSVLRRKEEAEFGTYLTAELIREALERLQPLRGRSGEQPNAHSALVERGNGRRESADERALASPGTDGTPLPRREPLSSSNVWTREHSIDVAHITPGSAVRHRTFGYGTVTSRAGEGRNTVLRIRFSDTERDIQVGLGLLEFQLAEEG